ncbi:MAG: alpha/beta hydrolase family protein [Solirubrobacterales bacterium]
MATVTVVLCLAPARALAVWEPAQPINDDVSIGGTAHSMDVAVGANGLATALFFQDDSGQPFFARRASGAPSWEAPRSAPPAGAGVTSEVQLAASPGGDALGAWRSGSALDTAAWPAGELGPRPVFRFPGFNGPQHSVALDDEGNGYAVRTTGPDVLLARFDPTTGSWVSETLAQGGNPRIAVNGEGEVAVTYTRGVGSFPTSETRLFVKRKLAHAAGFSDEQLLDATGGDVGGHAVAVDDAGAITAVFAEDPEGKVGFNRTFARRWLPGADPEDAELLSSPRPAYRPALDPAVAVDPKGRVTAAWRELEIGTGGSRVYSAERTSDRGFGFVERVSPSNEHLTDDESSKPPDGASSENERLTSAYDLAVDAEGTATIVYGASFIGAPVINAARRATGGRWSAPVSLRSDAPGAGNVDTLFTPRVAAAKARQADAVFFQTIDGKRRVVATRFEGPPPSVSEEHQTMVRSFDGTEILTHWCPAAGLEPGERAPTIVVGHGWGIPGTRCPGEGPGQGNSPDQDAEEAFGNTPIEAFIEAGYNVLTFDSRGFWRSGGTVQVDSPEFEGRDAQALIDYAARQPEALLDGPGDPRLGMSGGSYGGGIQLVAAALDDRVDAIAPSIAWNSLVTSLFPRGTVKVGWAAILFGAGVPSTTLPGVLSPAGIETGNLPPEVLDAFATAVPSGTILPETEQWFAERGPDFLLERIKAPTLLIQGTADTLFTLDEAQRNFEALSAAGTEVKMIWFCGGHGACLTDPGDPEHVQGRVLAWFDRHLRGREVSTGPEFEWIDEGGRWNPGDRSTLSLDGELRGSGSGIVPLTPGELPGSGGAIFATPSPVGVEVPIEAPPQGSTVLGAPQLRLTYSATGVSTYGTGTPSGSQQRTHVYAQVVDESRNIVVNNVPTPIPIELDGEEHEISLPLERIASRSTAAGYSLQIVPQTTVYDGQRAAGQVDFRSIEITLPVGQAVGQAGEPAPGVEPPPGVEGPGGPTGAAPRTAVPSNHFRFVKLKRNKRKGIAFLSVELAGPGRVGLKGTGLRSIGFGSGGARGSRAVEGGRVKLRIEPRAKGKRGREIRRALRRKGKAKVKVRITYAPIGGFAKSRAKEVTLVRK